MWTPVNVYPTTRSNFFPCLPQHQAVVGGRFGLSRCSPAVAALIMMCVTGMMLTMLVVMMMLIDDVIIEHRMPTLPTSQHMSCLTTVQHHHSIYAFAPPSVTHCTLAQCLTRSSAEKGIVLPERRWR